MGKCEVKIPVVWVKEHHPEVVDNDNAYCKTDMVNLSRHYDYSTSTYDPDYIFRQDKDSYSIMRKISRYGGGYAYSPDILVYNPEEKLLKTSQYCVVDDTEGHVKKLLGLFLKAVDEGRDTSFVIGKHCGPYEIREWNSNEKFLRVGCHCFLLENLREVYEDMKGE